MLSRPVPKALGPCSLFVLSIRAFFLADHRAQGKGCVAFRGRTDLGLRRLPFSSPFPLCQRVFSGSQGGDKLPQGISCSGDYIWPQKKEREVGKAVGYRSGGKESKRMRAKISQAKRGKQEVKHVLSFKLGCPTGAWDGKAKCTLKPEFPHPQEQFIFPLTSLGLGSWPCGYCPGARFY